MAKQCTYPDNDVVMANEDVATYPQGVTIPVHLPSTGNYSVEYLKKELTDFAMSLLRRSTSKTTTPHINWRNLELSDKVKAMSLGPSDLSKDTRSDKELLAEALEDQRSVAEIVGVSSSDVYKAIAERWDDTEDSIQHQSALSAKCDCILTRNTKDFTQAVIPIMTPEEFLKKYYS